MRKKQEQPQQLEEVEVSLSELPAWFDGAMKAELRDKISESEKTYNDIVGAFSGIKGRLDRLDRARISGSERIYIAANMIKDTFVRRNYNILNGIKPLQQSYRADHAYFTSFHDKGMEVIRGLKETTPKQTILLSRYFKKESGELVGSIRQAEDMLQKFGGFLKADSGAMGVREKIDSGTRRCGELKREMAALDEKASGLKEDISKAKEKRASLEREFLKLLKSRDWNRMNRMEGEIAGMREKIRETESRISEGLSSLSRPLKKLEHSLTGEESLPPMERNVLRYFVRDPMKAVMSRGGEVNLRKCLKSLSKQIADGRAGLSDKEKARIGEAVTWLENEVPGLKSAHAGLSQKLAKNDEELDSLSEIIREKSEKESRIKAASEDLAKLEAELRETASKRSAMAEGMEKEINNMETVIIEETQKRVTIRA